MFNNGWMFGTDLHLAICAVLLALAVWRGAAPERLLAGALLTAYLVQLALHLQFHSSISRVAVHPAHLMLDLVLLAAIAPVALQANRVYPLVIGGAQLVALAPHLAGATLSRATPAAIHAMNEAAFDIQLTALALGLGFHIIRRRQLGNDYPSWRSNGAHVDWIH